MIPERITLQKLFASADEVWRMGNWLMYRYQGKAWWQWAPGRSRGFFFRVR